MSDSLHINDWMVIFNLAKNNYKCTELEFDSLKGHNLPADVRCVRKDMFVKSLSKEAKQTIMEILSGSDAFFQDIVKTVRGPHGVGRQRFSGVLHHYFGFPYSKGDKIYFEIKTFLRESALL